MLKLFERSMLLQVVLVLAALALLWARSLASPPPVVEDHAILFSLIHSWLSEVPLLAVILAMILVLVEGFGLNMILAEAGLVSQNSLLPTLLYVTMASATITTLTPTLLVAGVMIVGVRQLMLRGTLLTIDTRQICTVTSLIGLCTMLYVPSVMLMASYLLIGINYRLYNIKDIAVMILGFFSPYVILLSVLFMTDGMAAWWDSVTLTLGSAGIYITKVGTLKTICIIVVTLMMLLAMISAFGHMSERTVVWKMNATTIMLLFVGGATMLLYSGLMPPDTTVMAIPFALCGTQMLQGGRKLMGRRKSRTWHKDLALATTLIAAILC